MQNDFRARLDWCVKPPQEANHPPVAVLNGSEGKSILQLTATPGEIVQLAAAGSSDPDGQELTLDWFIYREAGTYAGDVALTNTSTAGSKLLKVPADAAGKTIHVVLTVRDRGIPPLASYRRTILSVPNPP